MAKASAYAAPEWNPTDAAELRRLILRIVPELNRRRPVLDGASLEATAMSARRIDGFELCIAQLEVMATAEPTLDNNSGHMDMSTTSDNK